MKISVGKSPSEVCEWDMTEEGRREANELFPNGKLGPYLGIARIHIMRTPRRYIQIGRLMVAWR